MAHNKYSFYAQYSSVVGHLVDDNADLFSPVVCTWLMLDAALSSPSKIGI